MIALRYRLYLVGAITAGIVGGFAWPPPPLPKAMDDTSIWTLPAATDIARHVPQDLATVTSDMRWNGEAGSLLGEKSAWRLAGIIQDNGPAILVMTPDSNDKAQRVAIGGALPDGSVLQSVEGDQAFTKNDSCITTYQLFQADAVARSNGCEELDAPDQGISK